MTTASITLIDLFQAAEIAGMKHTRLARLARAGQVPHVLLPDGELRFMREELIDWIRAHYVPQENPCAAVDEIEAARSLGISASTLRELVRDGRLRRCKIYRCTRYIASDLQALAESMREPERNALLEDDEVAE